MRMLLINTADSESYLELYSDIKKIDQKKWQSEKRLGDDLLPNITSFLKDNDLTVADVSAILVYPGPGSFTGTRIGIATANALAWANNIPVIMVKDEDNFLLGVLEQLKTDPHFSHAAKALYGSAPSITLKKEVS